MTNNSSQTRFLIRVQMLLAVWFILAVPGINAVELGPPIATVKQKVDRYHGDSRVDPYFWLQEKTKPEVVSYLNAENAYAQSILATNKPLQVAQILSSAISSDSTVAVVSVDSMTRALR